MLCRRNFKGMQSEDAKVVDELFKDIAYREYLRGQIETRQNGKREQLLTREI